MVDWSETVYEELVGYKLTNGSCVRKLSEWRSLKESIACESMETRSRCSGPANVDTSGNLFARQKSSCNIEMSADKLSSLFLSLSDVFIVLFTFLAHF